MIFQNRSEAGRVLAARLNAVSHGADIAVVALPRGGVPVGYEIARALKTPLDVLTVRKLGAPRNPELAIGAVAPNGVRVLDHDAIRFYRLTEQEIEAISSRETIEIERQERTYHPYRPALAMAGREVIVTDDGLATGWTMRAAVLSLRKQQASRIVVAVPVASPSTCASLKRDVEEVVCMETPQWFQAVGQWYREFPQLTDEQVIELLEKARWSAAE